MSKLNELFVININKAIEAADRMTDLNMKPMAYASISNSIALYLQTENITSAAQPVNTTVQDLTALAVENNKVSEEIDKAISETQQESAPTPVQASVKEEAPVWQLPYDENGIPYLNDTDFADPVKVLAYNNALTPEIKAKQQEIINAQGNAVLNEGNSSVVDVNYTEAISAPVAPVAQAPAPVAPAPVKVATFTQEALNKLADVKANFYYDTDPSQLDNLYHNFTDGVHSTVADITPETIEPFFLFLQDELSKARATLAEWSNSWITKEGLDNLISQAYGVENVTIEQYVTDGNIFWFLEHIALYNANCWFSSYNNEKTPDEMNQLAKQYFDDTTATVANIDDSNVVGFIYFVQQGAVQIA